MAKEVVQEYKVEGMSVRQRIKEMSKLTVAESRSAHLEIARGLERNGQYNQAISQYMQLIKAHPDSLEAAEAKAELLELAAKYRGWGRPNKALGLYKLIADLP
ncbi:MAG: tol-pal system YbgF family protein [Candidatus Zixiibacteriota bacterium]